MLYRAELSALLAAHPTRFSVRHCISRAEISRAEGGEVHEARPGEREVSGRVSRGDLLDEFDLARGGGWGESALYLAVGAKGMERACWSWLDQTFAGRGLDPPKRLLRGGRWRSLVPPPEEEATCAADSHGEPG